MARTEKYFVGPKLLEQIRRVVTRVEAEPQASEVTRIPTALQEMGRGAGGLSAGDLRVGTFTGTWAIGETRTIGYINRGETATAAVVNLCQPVTQQSTATLNVVFGNAGGTQTVVEIQQVRDEEADICGKFEGPPLVTITFESCHGQGAEYVVSEPGGKPGQDDGPVSEVTKVSGGSGYAQYARTTPEITLSAPPGSGATFTPSFTKETDDCGLPYYVIKAVSVSGGDRYADGTLTVALKADTVQESPATLSLTTERQQPTVNASVSGGAGAVLSVSLSKNGSTPQTWGVQSVAVSSPGSGYADNATVTFTPAPGHVAQTPAQAKARTSRIAPSVAVSTGGQPGSGLAATVSLGQTVDPEGRAIWVVNGVSITSPGSGYRLFGVVSFTASIGTIVSQGWGFISGVSETGGVTGIQVTAPGAYYRSTGQIDLISVSAAGAYYRSVPLSVTVDEGGEFYKNDKSGTPYVASVTPIITQNSPSEGNGAAFIAKVDSDTKSPTFGQISALTIDAAGDDYLAWQWVYETTLGGTDLTRLPNYQGDAIQILGHASACLQWFSITTCGTTAS